MNDAGGNKIKYSSSLDHFVKWSPNHNMHCTSSRRGRVCSDSQIYLITEPLFPGVLLGTTVPGCGLGKTGPLHVKGATGPHPQSSECVMAEISRGSHRQDVLQVAGLGQVCWVFSLVMWLMDWGVHLLQLLMTHASLESWEGGDENFKGLCRFQWSQKQYVKLSPLHLKEHKQSL